MAESIVEESSQDEVCVELWDILEAAKNRAISELEAENPYFDKSLIDDLIYLVSRAGSSYRYHAEQQSLSPT